MQEADSTVSRHGDAGPPASDAGPWLSLVLRADQPFERPLRFNLRPLDEVTFGRGACFGVTRQGERAARGLLVALQDPQVSRTHARLQRVMGEWLLDDLHSKNGTWVNGVDVERRRLEDGDVFEVGRTFFLFRHQSAPRAQRTEEEFRPPQAPPGTLSLHPGWQDGLARLAQVARSKVPVVLMGETGTGKELAARNLHRLSGRPGAFVAVNCGAIPHDLVESELFGHRRGAYSGASRDALGLVRASDHGTLLLDEVADLPLPAQPALLRALQEEEVTPVGGTQPVPVDLRVICATHQDLPALAAAGRFRVDLLSRLSGITVALPALRERREDLGLLVAELLHRNGVDGESGFSLEAARALMLYGWPQNIRELDRTLAAAAVLADRGPILARHLPEAVRDRRSLQLTGKLRQRLSPTLSDEERQHRESLLQLLAAEDGNVTEVARRLQKGRTQVQRWIHRYDIDVESLRH